MPKPRKYEIVRCTHFSWRVVDRDGTWHADGRSNTPNAGRHSLGTKDRSEALRLLSDLDRVRAEDLGLVPRSPTSDKAIRPLPLAEGRKLYETHIARPRVTGGVRKSTQKRYRTVFDKFIEFATNCNVTTWNRVTADVLTEYAAHLEGKGYAHKSLSNELTTLKQSVKWLIEEGHLTGMEPIKLKVRKAESQRAYCYRSAEVRAMIEHCRTMPKLKWLGDVIIVLACTGLRIAELASLRWTDIDLISNRITLKDETGGTATSNGNKRELKSGRSRSFPIHPDLRAVLQKLPRLGVHVFYGPRGGQLKPDTVRRILVHTVIMPLAKEFPIAERERGFEHGRLHSFRHYFCSTCSNSGVPERIVMDWLGHADSEMIRHYYHLHDEEAKRRMDSLDFLGGASGRSAGDKEGNTEKENVEPPRPENKDDRPR